MNKPSLGIIALLALSTIASAQTNFFIQSFQPITSDQITLAWPSGPFTAYHVQFSNTSTSLWEDVPGGLLTAISNTTSLVYTGPSPLFLQQGFYRIREPVYQQVILTLVLDRSGSLFAPGFPATLTSAVSTFIKSFSNTVDQAALVTFATTVSNNVSMTQPFQQQIISAVGSLQYAGSSFTQNGLTNALLQEAGVVIPPGQTALKAAVLVTDGAGNIIQTALNCGGTPTIWDIGGEDGGTIVNFINPTNGNVVCETSGGTPPCCSGVSTFQSAIDGSQKTFVQPNVTADATYLTVQTANEMRANGITVYTVGIGAVDQTFFQEVANDPASPTYDPTQPTGFAAFASTTNNIPSAFQQIATAILANVRR